MEKKGIAERNTQVSDFKQQLSKEIQAMQLDNGNFIKTNLVQVTIGLLKKMGVTTIEIEKADKLVALEVEFKAPMTMLYPTVRPPQANPEKMVEKLVEDISAIFFQEL